MEHKIPRRGAALSYYTAFSLAPLITLVLSLASLAMRRDAAAQGLVAQFSDLVGAPGGKVVEEILAHAGTIQTLSWSTAISFVLLLVSASGAFGELQDSLDEIFGQPVRRRHWMAMLRERLLSYSMVFVLGFFMLTSLIASTFLTAASRSLAGDRAPWLLEGANTLLSLAVITLLFALLFRLLPAKSLPWRPLFFGGFVGALLFVAGKFLIGLYIAHSSFATRYGVAGSFVVLLVWVFYSAQILYFGAEIARTRALREKR